MQKQIPERSGHSQISRTGLAKFFFFLFHPATVVSAITHSDSLLLLFVSGQADIPLLDIEHVEMRKGWLWSAVRIRASSGEWLFSGIGRREARSFVDTLEEARLAWWRVNLWANAALLRSVNSRVAELADPPRYVAIGHFSTLTSDAEEVARRLPPRWPDALALTHSVRMLTTIGHFQQNPAQALANANIAFVANELVRSRKFFDSVESKPLTLEQRRAVVIDESRNLVVAAAGSGKTSVIVAKAGWLLWKGYQRPSELLLLAYAKDAQIEMEQRIRSRLGAETTKDLTVKTFHSLGISIIGEAEGRRPTLAKVAEDGKALFDLLRETIRELIADPTFSKVMITWFQIYFAPYRSTMDFKNQGEYWNYIRQNEIRSLKGELVKSYEECEIANFLYLNGVPYVYEQAYEHEAATKTRRQYQPDFYLSDAGIYIEHFALSASGIPAPFIKPVDYLSSMEWKRQLHTEHGTVLVETFSHEKAAGRLTVNLAAKLTALGVVLSPIAEEKVFAALENQGRVDTFTRLVAAFLQHFKGGQLTLVDAALRATKSADRLRSEAFVVVFGRIFNRYQQWLAERRQIDFHDMIIRATEHVEAGRYKSPFTYMLVDEFQDISAGRARLLKALLDKSANSKLFAVGDDWQAIYRFAGSDTAIMREFNDRFGYSERTDLGTTFRCVDRLAETASRFVLQNPMQIRKNVVSVTCATGPRVHIGLPVEEPSNLLREVLAMIAAEAETTGNGATVLLLGRYRHTKPKNFSDLSKQHHNLQIEFKTVHRSKGLEADYVIVAGMCSGKYGFPAEIADDPILDMVLAAPEGHPNAEERRLLYVALTRARRRAFLLTEGGEPSSFVRELLAMTNDVTVFGRPSERDKSCPICVTGHLERRVDRRGAFYGCSNRPYCHHTQPACPVCGMGTPTKTGGSYVCSSCDQLAESCPRGDGWMQPKKGRNGEFFGCTNWPDCSYTRNINVDAD
jgi:DNA helicase-4